MDVTETIRELVECIRASRLKVFSKSNSLVEYAGIEAKKEPVKQ